MKVYFVVQEPSERTINHFVSSLGKALQKQGCEVVYGLERLWTDDVFDCDIVHFQWPEGIFGLFGHRVTDNELEQVSQRLVLLKERGIRIFLQIHNLKPHTNKNTNVLRLYELLYQQADVMVHMGCYSRDLLQKQYPQARHVVIPHHIYDDLYSFNIPQKEARQRLHLPTDKQIILSFGKFRNDEERKFVLELALLAPQPPKGGGTAHPEAHPLGGCGAAFGGLLFLMPGFYRETLHTWNPKKLAVRLYNTLRYKLKGIKFSNEVIPDDLMQCYFCAADVVLIQRLDILNSGNLPMAFHAGKVVVGPNVGNVGQILRETGNFTFAPHDMRSAVNALQKALMGTTKGKDNRTYATEHWSSNLIATTLLNYYQQAPHPPEGREPSQQGSPFRGLGGSPLISVVLPTYNVAQYLQQCLESVAAQTYRNIEVIIIIDGATDGSFEIAQDFCKTDRRFAVYWQENAGSGPARNAGLARCKGELVMFVDPDDWIEPKLLEKLYEAQGEGDYDLVASTRIKVECDSKGQVKKIKPQHLADETIVGQDAVRHAYMQMLRTGVVSNPTQKLFKLSVIREHQVEFPPLKRSQDIVFNYRYYSCIQSLRLISYSGYCYRALPTQTAGKSYADYYKTIIFLYNDLQAMYQSWGMAFPEQEMCNWFFRVRIYSNLQKSVAQGWDMACLLDDPTIRHIVQTAKPSTSYLKMTRQLMLSHSYKMLKLFLKLIIFTKNTPPSPLKGG